MDAMSASSNSMWHFFGPRRIVGLLALVLLWSAFPAATRAAERLDQKKLDETIDRGLKWLASRQSERDGHWIAPGGMYPTAITALAATALLCEGSTTTQGKYAPNIRRAVDYLVERARRTRAA